MNIGKLLFEMNKRRITHVQMSKLLKITPKAFLKKLERGVFGADEIERMRAVLGAKLAEDIFFPRKDSEVRSNSEVRSDSEVRSNSEEVRSYNEVRGNSEEVRSYGSGGYCEAFDGEFSDYYEDFFYGERRGEAHAD